MGMSKSGNFRRSSLCFDEGLEKSSCFFHTPSFACLAKRGGGIHYSSHGLFKFSTKIIAECQKITQNHDQHWKIVQLAVCHNDEGKENLIELSSF